VSTFDLADGVHRIQCGPVIHHVRTPPDGTLVLLDHPDPTKEFSALVASGHDLPICLLLNENQRLAHRLLTACARGLLEEETGALLAAERIPEQEPPRSHRHPLIARVTDITLIWGLVAGQYRGTDPE
jgi:hypothetical protein